MIIKLKMCTTGKILVKFVSKNYCRYPFSKYVVSDQERAPGWDMKENLEMSEVLKFFISPLFYQPFSFFVEKKNKQNSNPHPFYKVGKIQLWLIKSTCLTCLLLILIQQYENTFFQFFVITFFSTVYKEHMKNWSKI